MIYLQALTVALNVGLSFWYLHRLRKLTQLELSANRLLDEVTKLREYWEALIRNVQSTHRKKRLIPVNQSKGD